MLVLSTTVLVVMKASCNSQLLQPPSHLQAVHHGLDASHLGLQKLPQVLVGRALTEQGHSGLRHTIRVLQVIQLWQASMRSSAGAAEGGGVRLMLTERGVCATGLWWGVGCVSGSCRSYSSDRQACSAGGRGGIKAHAD